MFTLVESKPYKGPESYQPEDASLFYGRDRESDQLIANILSSRFTLLHAQSGAGKTSILNARVVPGLQSRSWIPIRVLPQNDPVESIRVTTLQTLFPPLALEREIVSLTRDALCGAGENPSIGELLSRYDALEVKDPRKRSLVRRQTVSTTLKAVAFPETGLYDAMFSRVLRGAVDFAEFIEHLNALLVLGRDPAASVDLNMDARVQDVIERLRDVENAVEHQEIVNAFYTPVADLYAFFENLTEVYGKRRRKFQIVLLLDQFEELFTRFIDPGSIPLDLPTKPLDWRLRWELFRELRRLYTGAEGAGRLLPIRLVVSMRDEYIAQMDPLRQFVPELDSSAYHLTLLSREAAEEAIRQPAERFGYGYSDECFRQIVSQLTKEDRFVEPTHLQLVCEKLWVHRGRNLSERGAETHVTLPIEARELAELGGAPGILRSFFREFLDALEPDHRSEALDMLQLLVTSNGTRNIVEREYLTNPPFRRNALRAELLTHLEQHTIVRLEGRLGGKFAEITHEFLIGPILEAIRTDLLASPEYTRFHYALQALALFEREDFRDRIPRLPREEEFRAMHLSRGRIRWEPWSVELMLRAAIALGVGRSELEVWKNEFEQLPLEIEHELETCLAGKRLLTLEHIRALRQTSGPLTGDAARLALRSALELSTDRERDDISYWTERLSEYGAS